MSALAADTDWTLGEEVAVAYRGPRLRDGRTLLLMFGGFAVALGLGTTGAGVIGADPTPDPAWTVGAVTRASRAPEIAVALRLAVEQRPSSDCLYPAVDSYTLPGSTTVIAPNGEDLREYPIMMTTMLRVRQPATPSALDPYFASLDQALYEAYFGSQAMPLDQNRAAGVPHQ